MSEEERPACCSASRPGEPRTTDASDPNASTEVDAAVEKGTVEGMIELPGGEFRMGADDDAGFPADGEGPAREITLDPFYVDECAVTNAEFLQFVRDTDYTTEAEEYGWSFVFGDFVAAADEEYVMQSVPEAPWWEGVEGANWFRPEGPASNAFEDRLDHPVVHVSWRDAATYAEWAGKRLPTEAEWEYAARGGLVGKRYAWGDELKPDGEFRCNIWQGGFPAENTGDDGYLATAPVDTYEPNDYGLYNVAGNVWEWCGDWFSPDWHVDGPRENPTGPESGEERVMRGGSYLCHRSYCNRYRVAARSSNTPDSSAGNIGFRCVVDA